MMAEGLYREELFFIYNVGRVLGEPDEVRHSLSYPTGRRAAVDRGTGSEHNELIEVTHDLEMLGLLVLSSSSWGTSL